MQLKDQVRPFASKLSLHLNAIILSNARFLLNPSLVGWFQVVLGGSSTLQLVPACSSLFLVLVWTFWSISNKWRAFYKPFWVMAFNLFKYRNQVFIIATCYIHGFCNCFAKARMALARNYGETVPFRKISTPEN